MAMIVDMDEKTTAIQGKEINNDGTTTRIFDGVTNRQDHGIQVVPPTRPHGIEAREIPGTGHESGKPTILDG
jgi:hypothetical protein